MKPFVLEMTPAELAALIAKWGESSYRAGQLSNWVYRGLVNDFEEMTDLPVSLRQRLASEVGLGGLSLVGVRSSPDGLTRKWLFELPDGVRIETVLMCYDKRRTVCVSTQAGCAMGCVFCATGHMGLARNLSSGEIVEQVRFAARALKDDEDHSRVTNVVFMGMGEPFANYVSTMKAITSLTDPDRFEMGARRITVSTVGLVPGIDRFAGEGTQVNLSVSLHAASDTLRSRIVPVSRKYPLADLFRSVEGYIEKTNRRVTFEWAMISGVNDSREEAVNLAALVRGLLCHINLIPVNPVDDYSHSASSQRSVDGFRSVLEKAGIPTTVRLRRGLDIGAGCGQLCARER